MFEKSLVLFLIFLTFVFSKSPYDEPITNPVIFEDRRNLAFFVLSKSSDISTFEKLKNGFIHLEKQAQHTFGEHEYEIAVRFGKSYSWNFSLSDNFYDGYGNSWCRKYEKCFENAQIDNVEDFIDHHVPVTKPCPTKLVKEFILFISDTCLPALNIQLNDFSTCSTEFRTLALMLPSKADVDKCATQLTQNNATQFIQLFSSDLERDEYEKYADMKVQFQSTIMESTVNLFVMLIEYWKNAYDNFKLELKDIPLCKHGSISAYFQYITANLTYQRVAKITAPMNFETDSFIPKNYWNLIKDAKDEAFDCSFIKNFLIQANSMESEKEQYNVLVIEEPYLTCLEYDFYWNNTKRHLQIIVMNTGTITKDYTRFISFSKDSQNHLNFYNRKTDGLYEFWKDTTVCRETVLKRNITQMAKAIVKDSDSTAITKNDSKIWGIIGGIFAAIILFCVFGIFLRHFWIKRNTNKRISFIREKADSITSETKIPHCGKYWQMLMDDKDVIIDLESVLGSGSKSTVHKAILTTSNIFSITSTAKVAAKVSTSFETSDVDEFINELNCLVILKDHPHVIALKGWTLTGNVPVIITELAETNLLALVKSGKNVPQKSYLQILYQISSALRYITANKLIHRDVACRNVLLTETNIAKLADFGLCCSAKKDGTFQDSMHKKFPLKWLSIEALTQCIFSEKSDVWAFGILCFEIFSSGAIPYGAMSHSEMIEFLQDGRRLEMPEKTPDPIYQIMFNCWEKDPANRATFKEIHAEIEILLEYGYLPLKRENEKRYY